MRLLRLSLVPLLAAAMMGAVQPAQASVRTPHVLTSGAVGSARQAVVVSTASARSTTAWLSFWVKGSDDRWSLARNGVQVRIGRAGMTTSKREGDGKTPIGVFPVGIAFGSSNPGTALTWRTAYSSSRWVDDPRSALYNTWQTAPANGRWASAEQLRIPPYRYALEIGYNRDRTPGAGSAIFLHLPAGGATAGCVAADEATVVTALRWLKQSFHPVFVIGTDAWLAAH